MGNTVTARELRTRLGTYLKRAREGETLLITHRGQPIAELRPVADHAIEDPVLAELVARGIATPPSGGKLTAFEGIRIKGRTTSEMLLEDRD